jgi:hypothetical protein
MEEMELEILNSKLKMEIIIEKKKGRVVRVERRKMLNGGN